MTIRSLAYRIAAGALLAALLAWAPLAWRIASIDESRRTDDADRTSLAMALAMQRQLGDDFDDVADRISWVGATSGVAESFRAFEEAFWAINPDPKKGADMLRRHYVQNAPLLRGSLYAATHDQRAAFLASVAKGLGADDLSLVEPKKGYVIFSTAKGERFATPLAKEDPAGAVALETVKSGGGALFSGFDDANGNMGDGWIAAPIRQGTTTYGTLLVRIPAKGFLTHLATLSQDDPTLWLGLFSAEGKLLIHRGTAPSDLIATVADGFSRMSGEAGVQPIEGSFGQWRGVARGLDLAGWPVVAVAVAPVAEGKSLLLLLFITGVLALLIGGVLGWLLYRQVATPLTAHVNQISHLSQTGSEPEEGGFPPSGLAALDEMVGDLARSLTLHRAETEQERSSLQAYIDQLESMARVAAMATDSDGADDRRSRRKMNEERSFAETTWPRIKGSTVEVIDLLKTLEGESALHAVDVLERAVEELSRGFSAMAGPPEIRSSNFGEVDLATLAIERAQKASPKAEGKQIEIVFQRSDETTVVRGDAKGLTAMIDALLDNALTYTMPDGAVTVRVEKDDEIVRLTIADTGLGIAEGEEKKIFERFRRGTAAAATGVPGLGLGLSDAHAIALAHGARMVATSGPEKGAVLMVEFPDGLGPRQPTLPVS